MPIRGRGIDLDTMSIAEVQASTNTALNATSSATGNVALTLGPFTVEGPGNFYVEVFTPSLVKGTTNVDLELWLDGAPGTGSVLSTLTGHLTANATPCFSVVRVALTNGNHTLRVAGFVDAGSGTFTGGVGTTGTFPNSWARLWRA
jgi:hypothetical protein